MALPLASYSAAAFNQVPDSPNRIHGDEVARQYGFSGGLVPGVTVSAYLAHPAVVAWGEEWLRRGHLFAVCRQPLYDHRRFAVEVTPRGESGFDALLSDDEGVHCATATLSLQSSLSEPPVRRGDPLIDGNRVPATRAGIEELRRRGMRALRLPWEPGVEMCTYFRDGTAMPDLLRTAGGGFANDAFLLGTTNWLLAANVDLGPWLHLQVDAQHWAPVPLGSFLTVEGAVADIFEKKGHHFVDVDAGLFLDDARPAMSVRLRAIYRLAERS